MDPSIAPVSKTDIHCQQLEFDDAVRFLTPEMFKATTASDTEMIQACADAAKARQLPVIATGVYHLAGAVTLDSLQWRGGTFNGPGAIAATILSCHIFDMTLNGVYLHMLGGDCRVRNNVFKNQKFTAAFFISGMTTSGTLDCTDNEFTACYFGILQQASGEKMRYARFSCNNIHDIRGDGIELNVVNSHYADGLIVEGNRIHNVDGTGAGQFWGIGIGIAGAGPYGVNADDSQYVANFIIRNNRISACRQCIHVEMGRDFVISDNYCNPDSTKSIGSGLYVAGVAVYGSKRFTVENITGEPSGTVNRFILLDWGVNNNTYAGPPQNFSLRNIATMNGDIEIATSGANDWTNSTIVANCRCQIFKWRGLPSSSVFSTIYARQIDCIGQHAASEGPGGGKYARSHYTYSNWNNVICLDDVNINVSVSKMYCDRIDESGNNFFVPADEEAPGRRGARLKRNIEQYLLEDDLFPGGREFPQGTVLYKKSGGYFLVTTAGAYIKTTGTYVEHIKATAVGQTYIQSNMIVWSAGYGTKSAGCRIIIPGAGGGGADLRATIIRATYVLNGAYTIDIDTPILTATADMTIISAAYPVEFVEV
ncbi:parallel beta helix pectate lyase-like protein [Enterobacter sp. BIGb0383]|uniref:right-handed parallel beta-helix repeat-containing protein n=1 Tax=unclassified Enterobacter TaxID=2608935 RepID=UPI000F4638A2|nr:MULTISPECIES: right-handed parallel beta-helix repeat-containing protein [unclassified Enterobacter]ROP62580.1 parallel beta helix pectate lyase-like protein [Enterobacter sp. BIGb0383]ROS12741.1 parallel beta helix pectate lyase-like protein [Enterobacter sp. BIGb0359]